MKEPDAPEVLLCDWHRGNYAPLLVENRIPLYGIPPDTSHILWPLDQDIFRRMKKDYSQFQQPTVFTKISSTLGRVWRPYQGPGVIHTVLNYYCTGPLLHAARCACSSHIINGTFNGIHQLGKVMFAIVKISSTEKSNSHPATF